MNRQQLLIGGLVVIAVATFAIMVPVASAHGTDAPTPEEPEHPYFNESGQHYGPHHDDGEFHHHEQGDEYDHSHDRYTEEHHGGHAPSDFEEMPCHR